MNTEPEIKHFDALGLDHRVVKALLKSGLITPTKVQLKCIPIALEKKDILMRAKTGSGKTLAYCLPLIENILRSKACNEQQTAPKGLILAPTQELIIQINDVLSSLLIYCNDIIKHLALSQRGNHSISNERPRLLEKPDILICTPSRLVSHLSANNVSLSDMAYIIIDEADLIITHDFEADIKKIALHLPSNKQRGQILMCSATLNPNTIKLQEFFLMHHPIIIDMDGMDGALDGNDFNENKLTEYYFGCKDFNDKFLIIYALFKLNIIKGKCIIFVHNIDLSYRLKLFLEKFLIPTAILNPKLPFNSRQSVIDKFNRGLFAYLITTDAINEHDDKANIKNYWQFNDKNKKNAANESDVDIDRDTKMLDKDKDDGIDNDNKNEYEFEQDEDEKHENEVKNAGKASKSKNDKKRLGLSEQNGLIAYRGVDFREVAAVINFSAPYSLKKYIHRVGRTARAGNYGVAITLVTPREMRAFENIVYYRGESLTNLPLSMHDLDAFRYRCDSIRCSITQHLVKQARLNELRMEILNSERLESHFKERKREFELLRHDKMLQSAEMVKPHHSHIPSYMLSNSLLCNQPKNWRKEKSSNGEYEATFGQLPPIIKENMRKERLRKAMQRNPLLRKKVMIRRRFNLKHPRKEFNNNLTKNWGFFDKSTLIAKHEAQNLVRDARVFRKPINSWKDPLRRGLVKYGRRKPSLRGMAKKQVKKLRKRQKMRKLAKRRKK